jgi:hypothetical protein
VGEQARYELRRRPGAEAEVSGLAEGGSGVRVRVTNSINGINEMIPNGQFRSFSVTPAV